MAKKLSKNAKTAAFTIGGTLIGAGLGWGASMLFGKKNNETEELTTEQPASEQPAE